MERWRILEKENITFNISNKGRVQVLGSKKGKFIKTLSNENLSKNGGHKNNRYLSTHGYYVHVLVAKAFIGEIPQGYQVNHIDGNKFNNKVENLEIVTPSENIRHSFEIGLRFTVSERERELKKKIKETEKLIRQWIVCDLDFNILGKYDTSYEASKSINVSRQASNRAIRFGKPILKKYYIFKLSKLDEFEKNLKK